MMRNKWKWARFFPLIFLESCIEKYYDIYIIKLSCTFFFKSYFGKIINFLLCIYSVFQINQLRILLCILTILALRTWYKHCLTTTFTTIHNITPSPSQTKAHTTSHTNIHATTHTTTCTTTIYATITHSTIMSLIANFLQFYFLV